MLVHGHDGFSLSYHGGESVQTIAHAQWHAFYQRHVGFFDQKQATALLVPPIHKKDIEVLEENTYQRVVEATDHATDLPAGLLSAASHADQPFFMSLTTATAFHMPVSLYVSRILQRILCFDQTMQHSMEACLQEAISNALIHGNLAVKSAQHTGAGAAELFFYDMNRRLTQSPWRDRRLTISSRRQGHELSVVIDDEGDGFDVDHIMRADAVMDPAKPSGRGAHIIRALTHDRRYEQGGRRLILDFLVPHV